MKLLKYILFSVLSIQFLLASGGDIFQVASSPALAIDMTADPCEGIVDPLDPDTPPQCLSAPEVEGTGVIKDTFRSAVMKIVDYFLMFVGLFAVIAIIYGAFLWIFSGGEEENITKGKKIVLFAGAGIILILLSFAIVRWFISSGEGPTDQTLSEPTHTDPTDNEGTPDDHTLTEVDGPDPNDNVVTDDEGVLTVVRGDDVIPVVVDPVTHQLTTVDGVVIVPGVIVPPGGTLTTVLGTEYPIHVVVDENGVLTLVGPDGPLPPGTTINPNGSLTYPDGSVHYPDGSVQLPNGTLILADGTIIPPGSYHLLPDGSLALPDGTILGPGDFIKLPDGTLILPDGTIILPNGRVFPAGSYLKLADGTIILPDGRVFPPGTYRRLPDGTIILPDGTIILPNGTVLPPGSYQMLPDGSIVLPDGRILDTGFSTKDIISVKITATPPRGKAPLTVELSGIDSKYPGLDQTIPDQSFHWSYIDRSGQTVDLGDGHTIIHTLEESGRYVFTLRISKRENGTEVFDGVGTAQVMVEDTAAPVNFLINGEESRLFQEFSLAEASSGIVFTPVVEETEGREIQEYAWAFDDSSSSQKTEGPDTVTHIFTKKDEYDVTLTVKDALGETNSRAVKIKIADIVARIDYQPYEIITGTPVYFSGSESGTNIGGEIIDYVWTIIDSAGDKETINKEFFNKTFERGGNYQVTLTVRDNAGQTAVASDVVKVRTIAPIAIFDFSERSMSEPSIIVFEAGLSSDPEGGKLIYSWDFNNDGAFEITDSESSRTEYTYTSKGIYSAHLRVTDESGEQKEITKKVEIRSVLNVNFTADSFVAHPEKLITFSADSPNAVTYLWEFGDSTSDQGEDRTTTHSYKTKGRYVVKLRVFNANDEDKTVMKSIHIGEKDMPIAYYTVQKDGVPQTITTDLCGKDQSGIIASRTDMITLDASLSVNRDGFPQNLEYKWIFHDGTYERESVVQRKFNESPGENECFPVELAVTDVATGKKDGADKLWIKIQNSPPLIDAFSVTIPANKVAPVIVPLSVQNPVDRDGRVIEYKWWAYREGSSEKVGLHTTAVPSTTIILPVFGNPKDSNKYFFIVEIRDNNGAVVNSEELFGKTSPVDAINGENRSPVVDFKVEKTSIEEGETITFYAEASDPLGSVIPDSAYYWDFEGDNVYDNTSSGAVVTHRFDKPGEYNVKLKVVHRGLASSATKIVFVARAHKLPKAAFLYSVQGHNVEFDAGTSESDPSVPDNLLIYEWDFNTRVDADGDGDPANDNESSEKNLKHFYEEFGTISAKLTVIDRLGVEGEVIRDIEVKESGKVLTGSDRLSPTGQLTGLLESIRLKSSHPMTTLDVILNERLITPGEPTNLFVFVKNANNTFFNGKIEFVVVTGPITFSSASAQAVMGEAMVEVTGTSSGRGIIMITAKDTVSGDITEEIPITIE